MKYRFSFERQNGTIQDLEVEADNSATVADLAKALATRDPRSEPDNSKSGLSYRADGKSVGRHLPSGSRLIESGFASGGVVRLAVGERSGGEHGRTAATLTVLEGPDYGRSFPLAVGQNWVGRDRDCDVVLSDEFVSGKHCKVVVGDHIEVVDAGSSNGVLIDGVAVSRLILDRDDVCFIGDTAISVQAHQLVESAAAASAVRFVRSPRVDLKFDPQMHPVPEPPEMPRPQRLPIVALILPVLMAGVMFAMTRQASSVLFMAMSPLMMIGGWWEGRRSARRALEEATEQFNISLLDFEAMLVELETDQRNLRRANHPSTEEMCAAIRNRSDMLWTRRPEHESYLQLRLGLGAQESLTEVELPGSRKTTPELWRRLLEVRARFSVISGVPVVADLRESGSLGVCGDGPEASAATRSIVLQLLALHSPAELVFGAIMASPVAAAWDWLKWLPHTSSDHSPIDVDLLASNAPQASALIAALEDLAANRSADASGSETSPLVPTVVVLIVGEPPVDHALLVRLAKVGFHSGIHFIWLGGDKQDLPQVCQVFLEVRSSGAASSIGNVVRRGIAAPIEYERVQSAEAESLARRFAPVVDAGAPIDDESAVPRSVSFLSELGTELAKSSQAVLTRWTESGTLGVPEGRRRRANTLRAPIGRSAESVLSLDLRSDGPHALVGGTTGAGKSEFLQSWVLALATAYSPARVNFLFVDYKGGAAFGECCDLPHSVGLVTDLSQRLVRRALISLNAELTHREHKLNEYKAKDLLQLERNAHAVAAGDVPPSLIIVVDEFAALVTDVPEFVDGVVNVAQRGRSLGLHLVLATQRPSGVITGNLRANTNLRVALRMADEDDSTDVVGVRTAASFDPGVPGRGVAKTGPGRLTTFQSFYVGGWTTDEIPEPDLGIVEIPFGRGTSWEPKEADGEEENRSDSLGPNDLTRIVAQVGKAFDESGLAPARKPWMPELAANYDLAKLPSRRRDEALAIAVGDDPHSQSQYGVEFRPDAHGHFIIFGSGGSGKSTTLKSLAAAAALSNRDGDCHVYALDFGSRSLASIDPLPNVGAVILPDDNERIERLWRTVLKELDRRAERFSASNADSLVQFRQSTDVSLPRLLILIDNLGAYIAEAEKQRGAPRIESLRRVLAEGRQVGIHVAATADRPRSVPSALSSSFATKLVHRLDDENDLSMVGLPKDSFGSGSPSGRGYFFAREIQAPLEVQVATLGGDSDSNVQAGTFRQLAEAMGRSSTAAAPRIDVLPTLVMATALPADRPPQVFVGMGAKTLEPHSLLVNGSCAIIGPVGSGTTNTLRLIARRIRPRFTGPILSIADGQDGWSEMGDGLRLNIRDLDVDALSDWTQAQADSGPSLVIVENVDELVGAPGEREIIAAIKACERAGGLCLIQGAGTQLASAYSDLAKLVKSFGRGVAHGLSTEDIKRFFGADAPAVTDENPVVGRGFAIADRKGVLVQIAFEPE